MADHRSSSRKPWENLATIAEAAGKYQALPFPPDSARHAHHCRCRQRTQNSPPSLCSLQCAVLLPAASPRAGRPCRSLGSPTLGRGPRRLRAEECGCLLFPAAKVVGIGPLSRHLARGAKPLVSASPCKKVVKLSLNSGRRNWPPIPPWRTHLTCLHAVACAA